ncbi:hypothetical protein NYA9BBAC_02500 [Salinibacterium sp. NYA9b]
MRLARSQGWKFTDDSPGIDRSVRALDGLDAIDLDAPSEYLGAYASAAATAAAADRHALTMLSDPDPDPDQIAEFMVVGTALGDPLFAGPRRIAQEDATHKFFHTNQNRDKS